MELFLLHIQIYVNAPLGVPGVSKEPEGHKDQHLDIEPKLN